MPTCGDIDGKPCEWFSEETQHYGCGYCDATATIVGPDDPICAPVAALLGCRESKRIPTKLAEDCRSLLRNVSEMRNKLVQDGGIDEPTGLRALLSEARRVGVMLLQIDDSADSMLTKAEAELDELRGSLNAAKASIAELEAEVARLREWSAQFAYEFGDPNDAPGCKCVPCESRAAMAKLEE
jgi:hypothetical protein